MTTRTQTLFRSYIIEEYHLTEEPYYVPLGDEVQLFEAAYAQKIPLIFKARRVAARHVSSNTCRTVWDSRSRE